MDKYAYYFNSIIMSDSIKETDNNPKLIPFNETKNISYVLDFDDYMNALNYEDNPLLGFMKVIHMNPKYPQYYNIRYDGISPDNISIFTKSGWKQCSFNDILLQLEKEGVECIEYIQNNGKAMLEKIEKLKQL